MQLQQDFALWFREHVTAFPVVQDRLTTYLNANDADIWLITGSPQPLVEQVYFDTPWLPRVNLIATQTGRAYGGWVLTMRCLGHEKVVQLEKKLARRCGCTAVTATANKTTHCSIFASTAGESHRLVNFSNWNSVNHNGCV